MEEENLFIVIADRNIVGSYPLCIYRNRLVQRFLIRLYRF